ncbi:phosphoribosylformimino-5-aminoimidazole carboxamide ribotide isomerase [Methylobacterium sp. ap11]|uniref:HisA/HisF-related TIM barrel protein n=1 Tax=Methylobacterium sp. ap11 TaxID=1761799 RepID=UPI0008C4C2C3|nr:HisA/HisF-related TIM barrel protein [Methylobacterium sp. ap11]SEP25187.1 phosphoribosylformimino-5-aminoimidazole carboxamide ribotide isomerase [Methylobacterium sp. ap11]
MSGAPFATRTEVVPVLDLRGGLVVRARAGDRDAYAPIVTPLSPGPAPADVARGLLAAWPARRLYVADLDAIVDGAPPDLGALRAILAACPGIELWVDAGFSSEAGVTAFLASGLGRPVLGSESQVDDALVRRIGDRAVLSLDSRDGAPMGPMVLHEDPSAWPPEVIVMTLARVGSGAGPDLAGLRAFRARAPHVAFYAAGGLRGPEDLPALDEAGAAGVLVASAIHDGRLRA